MRSKNESRAGFTLIEILVVVVILAVILALLLPAVQSARESARRLQCVNNIKQLGIATGNYLSTSNAFPMGMYQGSSLIFGGYSLGGSTAFVAMLPYFEQSSLASLYNFSQASYDLANRTILGFRLNHLCCPSDPTISLAAAAPINTTFGCTFSSTDVVERTDYSACAGIWVNSAFPTPASLDKSPLTIAAQKNSNGVFKYQSSNRTANIIDGMSSTIAWGECANGVLPTESGRYGLGIWAYSGLNPGESSWFGAMYGINPQKRIPIIQSADINTYVIRFPAWTMSASSFHPGGANFGMADGSVRFIKDSIETFAYPGLNGAPLVGINPVESNNVFKLSIPNVGPPGISRLPLFQALCTIGGREIISDESF